MAKSTRAPACLTVSLTVSCWEVLPLYLPVRAVAADAAVAQAASASSARATAGRTRERLSMIDSSPFDGVVLAREGRGGDQRGGRRPLHNGASAVVRALARPAGRATRRDRCAS